MRLGFVYLAIVAGAWALAIGIGWLIGSGIVWLIRQWQSAPLVIAAILTAMMAGAFSRMRER